MDERIRLILLPAALLLVLAPVRFVSGTEPSRAGIKVYEREPEREPGPAREAPTDLDIPFIERRAEVLDDAARDAQIRVLDELIEMQDDADPEKPELLVRLAELYWDRAETFEGRASSLELLESIADAEEAGDYRRAEELRQLRESYLAGQREWQNRAVERYRFVEERYPGYEARDLVLHRLGSSLTYMDRPDDALGYFVRLASDYPQSRYLPDALYKIGDYYFDQHEFRDALTFYDKVLELGEESTIYGYAIFKQGWCYYNLGEFDNAFESFLAVIRHADAMADRGFELPIRLKREAQRDLVTTYSHVGVPGQALEFFKEVAPEDYLELSSRLASLYTDQGKFDHSSRLLQTIIREDPASHRVLTYQRLVVENTDRRGIKEDTGREAERLIALYRRLSREAPADFVRQEREALDLLLRQLATNYHREFEQTEDEEARTLARRLYGVFVELFPDSPDIYELRRNYGVLLLQQHEYALAVEQFEKVLEIDPEGEYTEEAAYSALQCYFELIPQEETLRDTDDVDVAPREIPEMEQRFISAADRFARMLPDAEDTPKARYAAGVVYYNNNHFEEAARRFREVIRVHRDHLHARDSALRLLSSYNAMGDIRSLELWADRLIGMPDIATGEIRSIVQEIRDRRQYNTCLLHENEKRYLEAAECFKQYTEDFPGTRLYETALYRAALNYDRGQRMVPAIETFFRLYTERRGSTLASRALFAIAKVYHNAAVYNEAARFYELYAEEYPDGEFVEEAVRFAARFRQSLGEYNAAVDNLNLYLRRFPKSPAAERIYFSIGTIRESQQDWSRALDHYRSYLRRYEAQGTLELVLMAYLRIAKVYASQGGPRAEEQAMRAYEELYNFFETLSDERKADLTLDGIGAVAEARFEMGDALLQRAIAIRLTSRTIEESIREKLEIMAQANEIFEDVYSFEHPHWQIAALNRVGVAYADLADTIEESPCPRGLTVDQCEIYKQDQALRAEEIRAQAAERFREALIAAREQQWFNRFSDDAEVRLAQIDYSVVFTSEFRARPSYSNPSTFPPSFRFAQEQMADEEVETP